MTTNNDLDALFADAELPFGHPGRRFDNTPEYFDHSPPVDQGPEPDYTPDEDGGLVHYGPGDSPLCDNDCVTAAYTDDPQKVRGLPAAGGPGPSGRERIPRTLPALPAQDHRPGQGAVEQDSPEALPALRKGRVVVELELAHGIQKFTCSLRQVAYYDNCPRRIERLYV